MQRALPDALGSYAGRPAARFHMPGHKGRGMSGFFSAELIGWDVTELSLTDNLAHPVGALKLAQHACARQYGAKHTFFLVNGSTAGIHAMLLSLGKGASLLLGRDCHRSALTGAALCGHDCRFIEPAYIPEEDMYGLVTPEAVESALAQARADAVLLTSPNYYGLSADIPAIAAVTRRYGAKLFVDAAHGAHFPFSALLPRTPAGDADAWVNSAHKTLNALGQSAFLHIGEKSERNELRRALNMVQTSSPSYLLLASLDWACYTAALPAVWDNAAKAALSLSEKAARVLGLRVLDGKLIGRAGVSDKDVTRLVIDVGGRGITGYAARDALEARDIFIEMADDRRIVCILTPADDSGWYDQLLKGLEAMPYGPHALDMGGGHYPQAERVLKLHEAARAKAAWLPLREAVGCIAADAAGVYPPGIAAWVPGERIMRECVEYLLERQVLGAELFGVPGGQTAIVR